MLSNLPLRLSVCLSVHLLICLSPLLQMLPSVSILFADLVSFTPMCKRLKPMEVVCLLNSLFVAFDELCDKHHVYKVRYQKFIPGSCDTK